MARLRAVVNGTLYTPLEKISDGVLLINGERIHALGRANELEIPPQAERVDAHGLAVVPGLVDLHTYGCLGAQLTTPDHAAQELQQLARNVARFGVTGFLISPPMGDPDLIGAMLTALAEAIPSLSGGARCLGIHLEGPYLDPEQHGAFPREVLRQPNVDEIARWCDAARGYLRIVTLAPNLPNAAEVASYLQARGIIASLGHSSASFEIARDALSPNGSFSLVTHIFNAMSGLHHRRPGVVGAALASDVPGMLICDGEHVHPAVVKVLVRAKGTDGIVLVTDAIAGAGMQAGEFELFGQKVFVQNGRATLQDGTLAGSVLTLNRAVANARWFAQIDFGRALAMATANPARVLGLDSVGVLREGAAADLAIMDEETGDVTQTIVRGENVVTMSQ